MGEELLDDRWVLSSHVIIFVDICGEIEEGESLFTLGFASVAFLLIHGHKELPVTRAHRLQLIHLVVIEGITRMPL